MGKTMNGNKTRRWNLPPIGLRIVKSAIGVFLCYVVSIFRPDGIVFYSQLAVLWCIVPYASNSLKMGVQRTIGTLIGAFFGTLLLLGQQYLFAGGIERELLQGLLIAVFVIPVIYVTVLFNRQDTAFFSCSVFLSIVVGHGMDSDPYLYVLDRILDTMIGVALGVALNALRLPRKKHKEILFISDLDDTLVAVNDSLTPYSKVELNRLLDDGVKLVMSTMRTPGSMIEVLSDIRLNMPVIAMDGAALYDIQDKSFSKVYVMSPGMANQLLSFIQQENRHAFITNIVEDMVVINYGDFQNEAEQKIFQSFRRSPYRNFVKRKLLPEDVPVYFMLIDKTERQQEFYDKLTAQEFAGRLKILFYPSTDYPGYSYIKIYNKNASIENMAHYLKETYDVERVITIGSKKDRCDVLVDKNDHNRMVKELRRLYEPVIFTKRARPK